MKIGQINKQAKRYEASIIWPNARSERFAVSVCHREYMPYWTKASSEERGDTFSTSLMLKKFLASRSTIIWRFMLHNDEIEAVPGD